MLGPGSGTEGIFAGDLFFLACSWVRGNMQPVLHGEVVLQASFRRGGFGTFRSNCRLRSLAIVSLTG